MCSHPKVSIVTVSYNQARFLRKAIESVLAQDYPGVEYLMLDGGSNDGSREIIEEYRVRFKYCRIGPDGGAAAALNEGFARATGKIFAYLNSDDLIEPSTVRQWVDALQESQADIVFGDIKFIDEQDRPTTFPGKHVNIFRAARWRRRAHAAGSIVVPQQAAAWRREVFQRVGGFNATNMTSWDGEFFVDAAIAGFKFHQIQRTLARFRIHQASISGSGRRNALYADDQKRVEKKWQQAGVKVGRLEKIYWRMVTGGERLVRQINVSGSP